MAESLYNIFGDNFTRQATKLPRQPLSTVGNENIGKTISTAPIKPTEPLKKAADPCKIKKSFLTNKGKAFQSTPARAVFSPRVINVAPLIYADENNKEYNSDEFQFTKPVQKYDHCELYDQVPYIESCTSPPPTPPPTIRRFSMEYDDEFFTDDFANDSFLPNDLPALY